MPQEEMTSAEVNVPNRNSGILFAAYLVGLVSGATAALLYAPKSGTEARRVVSEKAKKSREKATAAARQGREFVRRQGTQVNKAVETGRRVYRKALKREEDAA